MSRCEYCGESLCGGGCPEARAAEYWPPTEIIRGALRVARHEGAISERDSERALAYLEQLERRIDRALEYIKESGDDPACNIECILRGEQ